MKKRVNNTKKSFLSIQKLKTLFEMQLVNIPSAFMTFVHKLSLSSSISKLLNNETFLEELELFKAGAYLNDGLKVLPSFS